MTNLSADVTDLRIEGQAAVFSMLVDGPPGSHGWGTLMVYDASGVELSVTHLGDLTPGQPMGADIDLPHQLADGDYTIWVYASVEAPNSLDNPTVGHASTTFLVGRGHIYPSTEAAPDRTNGPAVYAANLRMEGDWAVFDMTNPAAYDVMVTQTLSLTPPSGAEQKFHGKELIEANATQQAHHLLPNDLADGTYFLAADVLADGHDNGAMFVSMSIEVHDHSITVVP